MSQKDKTPTLPVSEEITAEMIAELSDAKGDDNDEQQ